MSEFNVANFLSHWDSSAAPKVQVSKPRQIHCWTKTSKDYGGDYCFGDTSGLLPYRPPSLPADLNAGFETAYTQKDDAEPSPVDTIVQAGTAAEVDWSKVGLCTYRNNLNKILLTPLALDKAWEVDACFWGGTLFLDINKAGKEEYFNQEKMTYYGYKFEAMCTGQEHVDSSSEFAVLVQYRLGDHSVLMAAEIDCTKEEGDGPIDGQPYVELKTYKMPAHGKAVSVMYKEKHPRWWLQSFLAGVATLVLGARNHTGQLLKVHEVPVQLLPGLSANADQPWDPNLLLGFGDAVLTWIAAAAQQQPAQQLLVSYQPSSREIHMMPAEGGSMAQRLAQLLPG
ncbi:hypothetical protein COO60DRAFT_1505467 [Scenedesmus sp. NREL 46B-D3]|nr:hypothetical protein COO60DRAFT_1505467 [Scenedesmus sp. NREL 46B-D3]